MKVEFVDLKKQYSSIKSEIDNAIFNVIENADFILGEQVDLFEKSYAALHGLKHCISVGNGTDSLFIIMKSLGIKSGDEVITVCNSWISSSETISLTGAKPIFVDIDSETLSMKTEKLKKAISSRTKAIMPVHLFGNPCDMDFIIDFAKENNLHVIEDCAQAHLAKYKNQLVGTFGIASSFSFFPGKNLGAYGDAGAILTNDDDLANKCRMFARHGAIVKHNHIIEGINSRLDNIQAAILNVKIKYIKDWTKSRRNAANLYLKYLENCPVKPLSVTESSLSSYHLFVIQCDFRDKLMSFLKKQGISCAIHYPTIIPLQKAYSTFNYSKKDFPVGSRMQDRILSLPIFPEITEKEIIYIVEQIKYFYDQKS